jgi:AcrR family transcriptional regulator
MGDDQPERAPLRRDTIVAAARELIRTGGLDAVSLRRLAKHLGVTAPALYAHVSDKRDLLRAVAELEFDRLLVRFDAVDAPTAIDRIRAHCRAYIDHARENPELFDVMFLFPPDLGPSDLPEGTVLPAATKVFTVAFTAVEEAIAAGDIVADDPLLVSLALWTANHGVASALQLGFALPPELEEQLIVEVTDALLRGWAPTPARRSRPTR